jgi:hypothetical protein
MTALPTGAEALGEPFRAFPSWFMRITCDRCGKDRMLNEAHMKRSDPRGRGPREFTSLAGPTSDASALARTGSSTGTAGPWSRAVGSI